MLVFKPLNNFRFYDSRSHLLLGIQPGSQDNSLRIIHRENIGINYMREAVNVARGMQAINFTTSPFPLLQ